MKNHCILIIVAVLSAFGIITPMNAAESWTFGVVGLQAYTLDSYAPSTSGLGVIGTQNPTLTIQVGKRYSVTVTSLAHPLEIIAKGSSASGDIILLSMGSITGSFESDTGVAWQDSGNTVSFTLTQALYDAMKTPGKVPGYRCGVHTTTMRGNFNVVLPLSDPIPANIAKGTIKIELQTIVSGLAAPVDLKPAPDGTGRLFVVDQAGKVYVVQDGQLKGTFLDVSSRLVSPLGIIGSHDVNDYDERGLLGMAIHPDFNRAVRPGYHKIYTYTSEPTGAPADFATQFDSSTIDHQSVIAEWTVSLLDPNKIDVSTRREILRINEPQFNHNGGMLAFSPDGYLYISLGDGGAANDSGAGHGPNGNGQNKNVVLGKILRIDPLQPALSPGSIDPISANGKYRIPADNPFVGVDGIDEIFAYGFRNPYRFSFDALTGKLIVADVGQDHIEEIDIVQIGRNYGWNLKEGTFRFDPQTGNVSNYLVGLPADLIDPVAEYDHDEGLAAVGGYVCRDSAIQELAGKYVFGDFSTAFTSGNGRLFYSDLSTGLINEFVIGTDDRKLNLYVKGFGQDAVGELYVLASSNLGPYGSGGVVLKIVDLCTTRIPGDINNDCIVDFGDLATMASNWLETAFR